MRIISHRGNTLGPNPSMENSLSHLRQAIDLGYDVEVDFWYHDGAAYFGHDAPTYRVSMQDLKDLIPYAWFHCKNIAAMDFLGNHFLSPNFFWHQSDDYALTSKKYVWTYPHMPIGEKSIAVLPEIFNAKRSELEGFWGICTDYCVEFDPSQSQ